MPIVGTRAAQYAGWWNGGINISITNTPVVTDTVYRTPSYSILNYTSSDPSVSAITIPSSANIDLTGYSSLSGFNNLRYTGVITAYLDWPSSSIPSGDNVTANWANQMNISGTNYYYNPGFSLTNSNTQLQIGSGVPGGGIFVTLSGSYTAYIGQWLTLVSSMAETSSVFSGWSGGSSGGQTLAQRFCLYNTLTGALISRTDQWSTISTPSISSLPTTLPMGGSSNYLSSNFFGSSTGSNQYKFRVSTAWFAAGTCFDPVSATDTSWRTTRPSATIGGASAWYNLQTTNYANPGDYYITASGMDRYSQASNYISQNFNSTRWTNMYSNTIFPKDSS